MLQGQTVCAVIVAAGSAQRMGFDKMLAPLQGSTALQMSVAAFAAHPMIDEIVVVAAPARVDEVCRLLADTPRLAAVVPGGADRAASVRAGLAATQAAWAAIHDGARPFVEEAVITRALLGAVATGCAAPAVPVTDTLKQADERGLVRATPQREGLFAVQTPQVVNCARYRQALAHLEGLPVTDDCMVMEHDGCRVQLTQGSPANRKLTTAADWPDALPADAPPKAGVPPTAPALRIGHGYDVHRLQEGRALVLGGCRIPFEKGLLGHSDADVLTHAVMDALLGAAALGDIGVHFPDTDPAWAGVDSLQLLQKVCALVAAAGWRIANVDATLVCQAPRLAPWLPQMRAALAQVMAVGTQQVSVKATTEEHLGFTGTGQGVAAHAVALLAAAG